MANMYLRSFASVDKPAGIRVKREFADVSIRTYKVVLGQSYPWRRRLQRFMSPASSPCWQPRSRARSRLEHLGRSLGRTLGPGRQTARRSKSPQRQ